MSDLLTSSGIALMGAALGWIALFTGVVAPVSFKDLDHGRADRHVRRVIKQGHTPLALLAFAGAGLAAAGGATGAGLLAGVGAVILLMAQWALAPREDTRPPPGGRRRLQTSRIVAAGFTALMAPLFLAAIGLAIAGV